MYGSRDVAPPFLNSAVHLGRYTPREKSPVPIEEDDDLEIVGKGTKL
jgi:hypothetical protein